MDAIERLSRKAAAQKTMLASEHRHRYELAARLCGGMRVADVCCGTGYGCEILIETAASVTGVDVDATAIDAARADLAGVDGIGLEAMDALAFLGEELRERFDAIVILEGLEHLDDPEAALLELERHARDGLKLIISVPNDRIVDEDNPFHRTQYGFDEAHEAFARFEDATLLYQFLAEGSLIRSPESEQKELAANFDLLERGEVEWANHFIACVGFDGAPELQTITTSMHLNVAPLYNSHMRRVEQANRALWRTNMQLANERIRIGGVAGAASDVRRESAELELAALKETLSWRIIIFVRALRRAQRRIVARIGRSRAQ